MDPPRFLYKPTVIFTKVRVRFLSSYQETLIEEAAFEISLLTLTAVAGKIEPG